MRCSIPKSVVAVAVLLCFSHYLYSQTPLPRHLSPEQKIALKSELKAVPEKSKVRIVCLQDTEPCGYARDFAEVLNEAGWPIEGGDIGPITYARFTGTQLVGAFLLVSAKEQSVPPAVAKLVRILKSHKVELTFQSSDDLPKGTCEIRILYKAGEKPYYPN